MITLQCSKNKQLDKETLRKYRQIFEIRNYGHVWNPLDDKAVREAFVNLIIHADYLMDAGTLKVIKKNKSFEFTLVAQIRNITVKIMR